MSEISAHSIEERIKNIVAEIVEVEPEEVTIEADFVDDLLMDSMQALEILASLEKEFSVKIPEEYLGKIENLKSLMELLDELQMNTNGSK